MTQINHMARKVGKSVKDEAEVSLPLIIAVCYMKKRTHAIARYHVSTRITTKRPA